MRIPFPLKGGYFVKDDERVIFDSNLSEVKKAAGHEKSLDHGHDPSRRRLNLYLATYPKENFYGKP